MSASPTTHITRIAFAIACTIVASLAFTGAAWANSPTITKVDGNPTCADVGAGTELYKVEPVSSKSFSRNAFSGNVVVRQGQVFDFTVSNPVDVVIVKGGPNANVYRYTPETTSGTGLHAPMNGSQPYGLSHISFCQDFAPPPPPPPCTPGGSDTKADGTPCVPPPCTPGGSDTKADGTPCVPPPCTPGGSDKKADGTPCNPPPCTEGGSTMKDDGTPCVPPPCTPGGSDTKADGTPCVPPPPPPCTAGGSETKPDGTPCVPPPCTAGGSDMKADGTPCVPPPCTAGGSDMKADGTPCVPPPCTAGGSDMKADGTPCVPPPSAPPAPPVTVVASSSKAPEVLGVVGEIRAAANASMRSPRRCVTKPFTQVFTGRGIKKITVRVNGRVVRTLSGGKTRYSVSVDPRKYAGGVMRVTARVEYVASSRKRPQTLRATVLRCAVQASGPQFTG